MGAKLDFRSLSNRSLQKHIRQTAQDSSRVFFTEHACERMALRSVNDLQVLACLKGGVIERPPQVDAKTGDLKCRMEHFGSSRNLAVVVALDNEDPDILVVTVITQTR
jgi:hypothetical protein